MLRIRLPGNGCTGFASSSARPAPPSWQSPCACPSHRLPARPARSSGPGSSRQAPDQPGQGPGIIRPADPKPVPTGSLDLDLAVADRKLFGISGMTYNLDRQESGRLRRAWCKPCITHHLKIRLAFIAYRHATCATETSGAVVCRQIDRFSSSDQSRLVRRATRNPIVSTIQSGHYRTLYGRGRAVRPDGYPSPTP